MINKRHRIGEIKLNKYGSKMIIEDYISSNKIIVRFIETGNLVSTSYHNFTKGIVKSPYDKTVYSKGYIGIGKYNSRINGRTTKQYNTWNAMMTRCYNDKFLKQHISYAECKVCDEWHNFQNFAKWYDENFYEIPNEVMCLDKDILIKGNKIYSHKTCVFVPQRINTLFIKSNSIRGNLPIGVVIHKNKFEANCKNTKRKNVFLGSFNNEYDAFLAYKNFKENFIKSTAENYKNLIPRNLYDSLINYTVSIED